MSDADYRLNRKDHPVWSEDEAVLELARLGAIVLSFDRRPRAWPLRDFVDRISKHSKLAERLAGEEGDDFSTQIRRLVTFENITDRAAVLDVVAAYVLNAIEDKKTAKYLNSAFSRIRLDKAVGDHNSKKLKLPIITHYCTDAPIREPNPPSLSSSPPQLDVSALAHADQSKRTPLPLAFKDFTIFDHQCRDASRYLTGKEIFKSLEREAGSVCFASYRYSSAAGFISKSYFTFEPCTHEDPVCRFKHSFRSQRGTNRDSVGIVYSSAGCIYLLGQTLRDHAPKVLAFHASGQGAGSKIPTLVMSKSDSPLVSRALLVRVDKSGTDSRVASEHLDPEFSGADFRETIVPLIKNETEFKLGKQIVFTNEETAEETVMSQATMVASLPQLLRGQLVLRDPPSPDVEFNPAAHDQYPFNQAITLERDAG